ncbi:PA2779 family protein [Billgrantia kenyensis]|uniref:PA2779 family protein n=1 Tax=Billgrantia kenyensis TaxID=321266 RepID=A0A7W0AEL3_9GAMM|nr:PA2779 family protein [Halomonas kenyensis]MBA2780233.1 PA2779 family protein [Halomonas kenyensis]MCG6663111.1 PA2779 family protein [Halomonas kenyensis]
MKTLRRFLSPLLILALVLGTASVSVSAAPLPAGDLVSTQAALSAERGDADRERIHEILSRTEVQDQLIAQGVDLAEVDARVAALSDEEARQMAEQLEQLPAGASVVGALLVVFIVLLVTDILGLTNVFPFTR